MFFDGVGNQFDQSFYVVNKMVRVKYKRKGFLGRLKIKKKIEEKRFIELFIEQMVFGIFKVFGDYVLLGLNYKSVRVIEMIIVDEIVQQVFERYLFFREKVLDYVFCDVIGYFIKRIGSVSNVEEDVDKWIIEYVRVISDKEKFFVF